ncbi:MAG: hypothetical protein IID37_15075 [Planctomycetes bacterium]|nr:hypothetical protein [Planctomycetota bacterium]
MSTSVGRFGTAVLVGVLALCVSAGERTYTFYDITYPFCHSDPMSEATDVNDSGVVTGYFLTDDCVHPHGFSWINGVMTDLDDTYEKGVFWAAQAIARDETILAIGDFEDVLVLRDGVTEPLPVPPGCEEHEEALDMNDAGTMVAGRCDRDDSQELIVPAVYWIDEGVSLDLDLFDDLPADATGEARGVNDDGVVIGVVDGEQRSFYWIDGELTEILNGLGGEGVIANAINNHGLIVGLAGTADDFPAMSYDMNTGVMTVLGSGAAQDVNDRGPAVGRDIIDFIATHVILYENGEAIDLSPFFPPALTDVNRANAINNYGWIVGWADDTIGRMHGWLLVPVYDKGDYDGDGDVDHQDFQHFQRCFAAEPYPNGTLHVGCSVFDFDDNNDLDLTDYAAFQSAFTGPTAPNLNPNGPG